MEKYKILLVDDERSEREGVSFLIDKFGYPLEIKQAANGQKALELMRKEAFDILFTDVKMPIMDGLELAKEVSALYPDTIIIIFSAYSEFDFAKKAMEAGVVNYLLKPVEIDEFKICMDAVLEKIEKNRESNRQDLEQQEMVREALLYRLFRAGKVPETDNDILKGLLFEEEKGCILTCFEFVDNYFEHSGEEFLKMAKAYFKSVIFSEILPNEAFLVIRNDEFTESVLLQEQLEKLLKALTKKEECLVVAGRMAFSMEELMEQLEKINEIRKDIFLYGDRILFVGEGKDSHTIYARNIEDVKKDIFDAIEEQEVDKIREGCAQLRVSLMSTNELSRIYIQHLLYSIVKELYDKMPQVEYEDALAMAGEFFSEKKPEKVLGDFLAAVDRILTTAQEKEISLDSEIIGRIKRFIQKEYKSDLSLADVAKEVNLAPAYVSHIFKRETGQGIVEYITELKMKKAKQLLEDKSLKVIQIAKSCGYENQSYFNKLFKSYYGMTPKQYREGL